MLGRGWGVGKDAGVICILQEVHLVVGVGEVVSQVSPGLEGVDESVDDRIEYYDGQRVSLVDPDLEGNGWCNPVLCDDFPSEIRVERLQDILELGRR